MTSNVRAAAVDKIKMHYKLLLLAILLLVAPQALSKRKPSRRCPGQSVSVCVTRTLKLARLFVYLIIEIVIVC